MFLSASFSKLQESVAARLKAAPPHLTYHNLDHTLDVVEQAVRIAATEGANEEDTLLLKVTAMFHDIGYLNGPPQNHEQRGCQIFTNEALSWNFSNEQIEKIIRLIMATKIPQKPTDKLERIICDADLDYLGSDGFLELSERLKKEFLHFRVVKNETEWYELQLHFLKNQRFFTDISKASRQPVLTRHIEMLAKRFSKK